MNIKQSLTKKISFTLVISILFINLSILAVPQRVQADLPVTDPLSIGQRAAKWISDLWEKYGEDFLTSIARAAAKKLVQRITASTVDWIRDGGLEGNKGQPAFLADLNGFLAGEGGVLDSVMGEYIDQTELKFLCDPFQAQLSLALSLKFGSEPFRDGNGCTVSGINRNINNAINNAGVGLNINGVNLTGNELGNDTSNVQNLSDFALEGGWASWLQSNIDPQKNPIAAYISSETELTQKLAEKVKSIEEEQAQGGGALSFKTCTDSYTDRKGNPIAGPNRPYTVGPGAGKDAKPTPPKGAITKTNCVVKTPGPVITEMLGMKANNDTFIGSLSVVMSDGIDAIVGAVADYYITKGLNQLSKGVLHSDKKLEEAEQARLSASIAASTRGYNLSVRNSNTALTSAVNTTGAISTGIPLPNVVLLPEETTTSTTTPTQTSSGSSFGGAFDQARNNSIILLNSLSASESAYQNNYLIAQNVLTQGRAAFATSSVCNINYNRTSSVLRASLIRSNVLTNIDGTPDSSRSIASIPWNLLVINAALAISNTHMTILSTAASGVNTATDINGIQTAMLPVNSTNFNTDPQSTLVTNIKTWLSGARNLYDSLICPINITSVLQINSPATP